MREGIRYRTTAAGRGEKGEVMIMMKHQVVPSRHKKMNGKARGMGIEEQAREIGAEDRIRLQECEIGRGREYMECCKQQIMISFKYIK